MASFAERMGHRAARTVVQSDDLDGDTRTALWNILFALRQLWEKRAADTYREVKAERDLLKAVWTWEFKYAADEQPNPGHVWSAIKKHVLSGEWFDVLDMIEEIVKYVYRYEDDSRKDHAELLAEAFNNTFESQLVGYRFIGRKITPVDSNVEAEAVSGAQEATAELAGARHALDRAVEHLADRQKPDYPNSIKESISAVEAVVRTITGETTLGSGLSKLESAGLTIHPALKGAWSKMYGYTSDDDGIRHGGIEAANADQALAKYMLVTCSAFVSYLIEEGRKTKLL